MIRQTNGGESKAHSQLTHDQLERYMHVYLWAEGGPGDIIAPWDLNFLLYHPKCTIGFSLIWLVRGASALTSERSGNRKFARAEVEHPKIWKRIMILCWQHIYMLPSF
jgi:hypothetical protein